MTLRLTATQTDALRRRAVAERTSMQDVVHRALEHYLRVHGPEVPIGILADQEIQRFAGAIEHLSRWRD